MPRRRSKVDRRGAISPLIREDFIEADSRVGADARRALPPDDILLQAVAKTQRHQRAPIVLEVQTSGVNTAASGVHNVIGNMAHVTRRPRSNRGAAVADNKLSSHILPTSSTMVGVCMTAVTLVKLGETTTALTRVDELMAFDGLLFLVSAILSYMAIRTTTRLAIGLERMADAVFMLGLCLTVVASFLLAYSIF